VILRLPNFPGPLGLLLHVNSENKLIAARNFGIEHFKLKGYFMVF